MSGKYTIEALKAHLDWYEPGAWAGWDRDMLIDMVKKLELAQDLMWAATRLVVVEGQPLGGAAARQNEMDVAVRELKGMVAQFNSLVIR